MLPPLVLSGVLLAWSLVANLLIGDHLYVGRNVVLTLVLLIVARRLGLQRAELGFDRASVGSGLRWGGGCVLVVGAVVAGGAAAAGTFTPLATLLADQRAALPADGLLWATLVRIPFGTALFEEVAFRGLLLALFLRALPGRWPAVVWSSVVFGLWHVAPTIVTLEINAVAPGSPAGLAAVVGGVVATTVGGLVFSGLRVASGSLVAPILAHWATNAFALLAAATVDLPAGSATALG